MKLTKNHLITTAGETMFCKEIMRYSTMVYVATDNKECYALVTCNDYLMSTKTIIAPAIQFMDCDAMNIINIPYDKNVFQKILSVANDQFFFIKEEEASGAAV